MRHLKYLNLWIGIGTVIIVSIWFVSLMPNPPKGPDTTLPMDKIVHFIMYFTVTLWHCQITKPDRHFHLFVIFLVMGALIEGIQQISGYRSFEMGDILANGIGTLTAFMLCKTKVSNLIMIFEERVLTSGRSS